MAKKPRPVAASAVDTGFPIVGIGASAGGLEALKQFFDAMPPRSGIGFVAVTHQHVGHVSMLPELLSKRTRMVVCEAVDGMQVLPNHVYLAPPSGQLYLLGGTLHLIPTEPGLHLPIDGFFRSLAIDQKSRAIATLLSGTGTDGTLGIKAIKGESGMVMVQDPDSAKYDGMPRSAIATGDADFILPPVDMPRQLLSYAAGPFVTHAAASPMPVHPGLIDVLPKIFVLLRNRTRHDFSHYKSSTVLRRIERRMSVHQIAEPKDYLRYLQESPQELDVLFRELLIGVTSFFRDPEAFESLATRSLPKLLQSKPDGYVVRIWSAGCSTGEEAYSLTMIAREVIDRVNPKLQLQVFATDLDDRAIEVARRGVYPDGIRADVSEQRLQRFFTYDDGHYRIRKGLREHLIFAPQDIIADPPFTHLDVLACRNVLIYMNGDLQKKLLPVFHYAIKPGGILFLGNSESIGKFVDLFGNLDKKAKLCERKPSILAICPPATRGTFKMKNQHPPHETPPIEHPAHQPHELDLVHSLERRLLRSYAPPSVIASDRGEIVYIHGRTGAFLEPASGEPSDNIFAMARPGLQPTLTMLMRRAAGKAGEPVHRTIRVATNGGMALVNVVVRTITEPETIRGLLMITFEDAQDVADSEPKDAAAPKKNSRRRVAELEQELKFNKESLQSTIEELETTNEELISSNEELQSTNEELQSTNEELETSNEEMQSMNEEMQTVNAELQMKIEDLALANDDMANLLNNTGIATIFLDNELNINRFTKAASDVVKIIPTDVGRPIGDLVSSLDCDLVADGIEVLETLMFKEREVAADDGRWYRVRMMPYRTSENVINGLVVTFVDVTANKENEIQISKIANDTESIVDTVREPMLILDEKSRVVSANRSF